MYETRLCDSDLELLLDERDVTFDMNSIPAASPPVGITANFDDPQTNHNAAGIIISLVGMALSAIFILLRLYTKIFITSLFGIDDVAMVLAWVSL